MTSFNVDSKFTLAGSVLAANGLIGNSGAGIIGSMLVSPYMNPVLAFSNGLVNGNVNTNEAGKLAAYILISVLVGMVYFKLYTRYFGNDANLTVSGHDHSEMNGRTDGRPGVYIHAFIYAFVAGLVISFMVIGLNDVSVGTMVGLGIGASLLPPAVNAGLFLAMGDNTKAMNSLLLTLVNIMAVVAGYVTYAKLA